MPEPKKIWRGWRDRLRQKRQERKGHEDDRGALGGQKGGLRSGGGHGTTVGGVGGMPGGGRKPR
jgi:hypothetical protein